MKKLVLVTALAASIAFPVTAQEVERKAFPSPNEIVENANASDWVTIAPEDLLVMDLAADRDGRARRVVIQLMPAPFSQGWVRNIRKLARAEWYDGTAIVRVQDNYVTQWGDPDGGDKAKAKKLPEGLEVVLESAYAVSGNDLSEANRVLAMTESSNANAEESSEVDIEADPAVKAALAILSDSTKSEEQHEKALDVIMKAAGLDGSKAEDREPVDMTTTKSEKFPNGWHDRDSFAEWVEIWRGWPLANHEVTKPEEEATEEELTKYGVTRSDGTYEAVLESKFWPVHCYGMVGVGRSYSPDTGSGAELYTVIGHAPRHLDRNIALVGRIIEGMEHMSSLPRGTGPLGFYEDPAQRVPIQSVRLASELEERSAMQFEYLSTESEAFARYADARANRRDPFFIKPAGGADICNIPVPVRRKK